MATFVNKTNLFSEARNNVVDLIKTNIDDPTTSASEFKKRKYQLTIQLQPKKLVEGRKKESTPSALKHLPPQQGLPSPCCVFPASVTFCPFCFQ